MIAVVRGLNGYGDMFLHRADNSWQQWLHVSKDPPSLIYSSLELGLLCLCLAALMAIEPVIGVRENGAFLVFGRAAMCFYLVHRLAFEAGHLLWVAQSGHFGDYLHRVGGVACVA